MTENRHGNPPPNSLVLLSHKTQDQVFEIDSILKMS